VTVKPLKTRPLFRSMSTGIISTVELLMNHKKTCWVCTINMSQCWTTL